MSVRTVISHLSGRQVEVFYVLLVSSGKYSFLPELYDIFGRKVTIKFLELFAGCSLKVPRIEKLEELARAATIYVKVESAHPGKRGIILESLADDYEISVDRVRRIYVKTKVKLENDYGFRIVR